MNLAENYLGFNYSVVFAENYTEVPRTFDARPAGCSHPSS